MTQPVLEYEPPNSSRRHAVGGLVLLGLCMALISGGFGLLVWVASGGPSSIAAELFLMVAFILGVVKMLLAYFVARRNQPLAWTAFALVAMEAMGMIGVFVVNFSQRGPDDSLFLPLVLLFVIVGGWVAVGVEIVRAIVTDPPIGVAS